MQLGPEADVRLSRNGAGTLEIDADVAMKSIKVGGVPLDTYISNVVAKQLEKIGGCVLLAKLKAIERINRLL